MHPTLRKHRSQAGVLLLLLAAACDDPVAPPASGPEPGVPAPTQTGAQTQLDCVADTRDSTVVCTAPGASAGGARGAIIVGGQGQFVNLTSTNIVRTTDFFQFDVTVQNLIPQPMATTNGTTPDVKGVRVFFESGPTVTSGTGGVWVHNNDGVGNFTAPDQFYFQYAFGALGDGILEPQEISEPSTWVFELDPTVQTFSFSVRVSTEVPFPTGWVDVTPKSSILPVGETQVLTPVVRSQTGVVQSGQSVSWASSAPSVATVNAAGVVTAVAPGITTITATSTTRTGTAVVRVCTNPSMSVGDVRVLTMPADGTFCLDGGGEYTVVPLNSAATDVGLSLRATGITPVIGAPSPFRAPLAGRRLATSRIPRLRAQDAFEQRLRAAERTRLTPHIGAARKAFAARTGGARRSITPGVPTVGDLMQLNVGTTCSSTAERTGRVAVVGTHSIVIADTLNPDNGIMGGHFEEFAARFDTLTWPALTAAFGTPEDVDGNGRVILFVTTAVNAQTPTGEPPVSHGYTLQRDLFPTSACPASNAGEMIYLAAIDPQGTVNGNVRSMNSVVAVTDVTIAHETEHLISASRRIYVNFASAFEETWLDEGLAHVAEELVFYAAGGRQPRQNLGFAEITGGGAAEAAFVSYAEPNYARLREWLREPNYSGLFQPEADVASRGALWAFLRYAADRKGGTESAFWNALVNSTDGGLTNLQAALGADPHAWSRDFAAALYSDDAVAGTAATYTHPSWNFRSLYNALDYGGDRLADGYPLLPMNPVDDTPLPFALERQGGATWLRMGVSGDYAGVILQSGSAAPPSTVLVTVIRRK
jgi:hypothetical protein